MILEKTEIILPDKKKFCNIKVSKAINIIYSGGQNARGKPS